jgi:hypothetical protein
MLFSSCYKADTAALIAETHREIVGVEPIPGTNFAATFGHLGKESAHKYIAEPVIA